MKPTAKRLRFERRREIQTMEHFNSLIILGLRAAPSSHFLSYGIFYERIIRVFFKNWRGRRVCRPLRHFYVRRVTFRCGNRRDAAVAFAGEERVNTPQGCPCAPCSREGITRHRFLLSKPHVDRCGAVARRDAWPFVRKVASVSGRNRFIVPGGIPSPRPADTYDRSVRLRSIVVAAAGPSHVMHARKRTPRAGKFPFQFAARVARY